MQNEQEKDNIQVWHDPKLKPPKPFKTKIIRPNDQKLTIDTNKK